MVGGNEALNAAFFALKKPETAIYFDAIEAGLRHLIKIQSIALSMPFYGSLARNTIRPNRSDLCDAFLILDDAWWREYGCSSRPADALRMAESLRRMLEFVEQACASTIKRLESHNQIDLMLDI